MSAAFHRGITQVMRRRLQTAGIRVEESDARKALAGATVVTATSPAQEVIWDIAHRTWAERFTIMSEWENDHPGESPFPPVFAEVVLAKLREAILDSDALLESVTEVIKLAEAELEL